MITTLPSQDQTHQDSEAPMLAHLWVKESGPNIALCGKRLMGFPAPDDADTCVVCEDLAYQRWMRRSPF